MRASLSGLLVAVVLAGWALGLPCAHAQDAGPPAVAVAYRAGEEVDVLYNTTWYPGTVLTVLTGQWEIAYDGYGPEWHQVVGPERIRERTPAPPPPPPPPPPGHEIRRLTRLGAGTQVLVEWRGTWYRARILSVTASLAHIHYVGYGRESDEDVTVDRVRLPDKA